MLHAFLAILHALSGAIWLGAMFHSVFILQPRAQSYFGNDADFEAFVIAVSQGGRAKFLLALGMIVLAGMGLAITTRPVIQRGVWLDLLGVKTALFVAIILVFAHISWRLWPMRLFAAGEEVGRLQRAFRRMGVLLSALAAISMALGVLMHTG